jgi:hypothetical protein
MKVAVCDPDAFYPLRSLVSGPLDTLDDLPAIERFIRTVLLHDEIVMELTPWPYDPETDFEFTEEERRAGGRNVITAIGPVLTGFDFFTEQNARSPVPEMELTPSLLEVASKFANAETGNIYFDTHVEYLKRVLGVCRQGGSALLAGEFGQTAITATQKYPDLLFENLDKEWQDYATTIPRDGLGLHVPPMLGVVLSRCARRDAIPVVIRELRAEWAGARKKVWQRLDALQTCRTIGEAVKIKHELAEASRLFSPQESKFDSTPIRVLWEILAAPASGALVAQLSGGDPLKGAVTNTITQVARSVPGFVHEFGRVVFGRGAFDLANKVRREVAQVEFDSLRRILSDTERRKLGLD